MPFFAGYPITPQNEIPEYFSRRLPEVENGLFVQAEADYLYRDSDIPNFDIENFGAALSVGLTF